MKLIDIEEINGKFDAILAKKFETPTAEDVTKYQPLVTELLVKIKKGKNMTQQRITTLKHKYHLSCKNSFLVIIAQHLFIKNEIDENELHALRNVFRIKRGKSHSGVLVITLFTSPYPEYTDENGVRIKQSFSCAWNCAYCPAEPDQPRSYLKGEPGVLRGNRNNFNCMGQMWDRMNALSNIGHPVDKLEIIVLGGTWASYPLAYREEFIRDVYYSANVYWDVVPKREPMSLKDEMQINWDSSVRVIGLTLETRPDTITPDMIRHFRNVGCTRVQLGIQHIDEDVLRIIRRQCTTERTIKAIKMLKDTGFKVDGHWMPNLPGTTVELDRKMLIDTLLGVKWGETPIKRWSVNKEQWEEWNLVAPELQLDQWKVYPCALVPWTDIEKWYKDGSYKPYENDSLERLLIDMKMLMFPWIRLNRIIRDIPSDYIMTEGETGNMRQELGDIMKKDGTKCNCIRCKEVKERSWDGNYNTVVRKYNASEGADYFISAEDDQKLYGFVRLRISKANSEIFKELEGCAFIRELHVYGNLETVNLSASQGCIQHKGIGKHLMSVAHRIAKENSFRKCAVIAGEGTRRYYEKIGYINTGSYMINVL